MPNVALPAPRESDVAVGGTALLPEPPSANRWWRNVNGRMVTSREAREYKALVAIKVPRGQKIAAPQPVAVRIDWYRGRKAGDLDKRLGVLLDALQGSFYDSDAQIVEIVARRFDDPRQACVRVEVSAA